MSVILKYEVKSSKLFLKNSRNHRMSFHLSNRLDRTLSESPSYLTAHNLPSFVISSKVILYFSANVIIKIDNTTNRLYYFSYECNYLTYIVSFISIESDLQIMFYCFLFFHI